MNRTFTLLGALALATTTTAIAGEHPGHGGPLARLKAADTNGDGLISRAEAAALPRIARHFDAIDTNKDGQLSQDELRAFHQTQRAEHFRKIDTDGDGRISKAEAQAGAPRLAEHFDRIDANKDGFLTSDELQAAHAAHRPGKK